MKSTLDSSVYYTAATGGVGMNSDGSSLSIDFSKMKGEFNYISHREQNNDFSLYPKMNYFFQKGTYLCQFNGEGSGNSRVELFVVQYKNQAEATLLQSF